MAALISSANIHPLTIYLSESAYYLFARGGFNTMQHRTEQTQLSKRMS